MVDPVTTLGLASSVIQFIDFSMKLVDHKSSGGSVPELHDAARITQTLKQIQSHLQFNENSHDSYDIESERLLEGLCSSCDEIATELLEILDKVKIQGNNTAWKSMRHAIKTIKGKSAVSDILARLKQFQQLLETTILIELSTKISFQHVVGSEKFMRLDTSTQEVIKAVMENRTVFSGTSEKQTPELMELYQKEAFVTATRLSHIEATIAAVAKETNHLRAAQYEATREKIAQQAADDAARLRSRMDKCTDEIREFITAACHAKGLEERRQLREKTNAATAAWAAMDLIYESLKDIIADTSPKVGRASYQGWKFKSQSDLHEYELPRSSFYNVPSQGTSTTFFSIADEDNNPPSPSSTSGSTPFSPFSGFETHEASNPSSPSSTSISDAFNPFSRFETRASQSSHMRLAVTRDIESYSLPFSSERRSPSPLIIPPSRQHLASSPQPYPSVSAPGDPTNPSFDFYQPPANEYPPDAPQHCPSPPPFYEPGQYNACYQPNHPYPSWPLSESPETQLPDLTPDLEWEEKLNKIEEILNGQSVDILKAEQALADREANDVEITWQGEIEKKAQAKYEVEKQEVYKRSAEERTEEKNEAATATPVEDASLEAEFELTERRGEEDTNATLAATVQEAQKELLTQEKSEVVKEERGGKSWISFW